MKLTNDDKSLLRKWCYPKCDFLQIEHAMEKSITTYSTNDKDKITRDEAIRVLGREMWLSGIARSAFHRSAARQTEDEKVVVYFDSHKLFR